LIKDIAEANIKKAGPLREKTWLYDKNNELIQNIEIEFLVCSGGNYA